MRTDPASKLKLGARWQCFSCGAKFYDLNRPDPLCPKCGTDQRESPLLEKPKRTRTKKTKRARAKQQVESSPTRQDEGGYTVAEAPSVEEPDLELEDLEVGDTDAAAQSETERN